MNLCLKKTNICDDVLKVLVRLGKVSKLESSDESAIFCFKEISR